MNPQPPLPFGTVLRRYRLAAGLTQAELGERARLSVAAINTLERGVRRTPRKDTVVLIADALTLTADERAELEGAARPQRLPLPPAPRPPSEAKCLSPEALPPPEAGPPHRAAVRPAGMLVRASPLSPPSTRRTRRTLVVGVVSALLVVVLLVGHLSPAMVTGAQSRPTGGTLCLATEFPTSDNDPMYGGTWGKSLEDAVRLAVQQHQSLGNGYTLIVKPYREASAEIAETDPRQAAQDVTDMVKDTCIVGMVGPVWSKTAAVEMPIAANAGLVIISPANTEPGLTLRAYAADGDVDFDRLHPPGKMTTYFRTIASDVLQGRELGALASRSPPSGLGARSAFVIDDHSYNEPLIGGFAQEFLAMGGGIVGTASIPFDGATRISELVPTIMASHPDVVVYGGLTEQGGGLLKTQLVQAGYQGNLVSGDGIARDPAFVEQVSPTAANGIYAIDPVPDPSQLHSSVAARFIQDFGTHYPGEVVDGYGVNAYDAAIALIATITRLIQQGRVVTRETVLDQIQTIQTEGVTGPIAFDHNGDSVHGTFSVYTVRNGQWVWIKQLDV